MNVKEDKDTCQAALQNKFQVKYQTALLDRAVVHGFKFGRIGTTYELREVASILDRMITITSMMEHNKHWGHEADVDQNAYIIRKEVLTPWESFIIHQSKMVPFEKLLASRDLS